MTKSRISLFSILLLMLGMIASPGAWAGLCTSVWGSGPQGNGLSGSISSDSLNLPAFQGGAVLTAANPREVSAGDSHWSGGSAANGWSLVAPGTGTARVFVKGDLEIYGNNVELNAAGNTENLVLIIDGNLVVKNNVVIRGFIYVTGSIEIKNNATISGAISAGSSIEVKNNLDAVYDGAALQRTDFGGLCSAEPALYLRLDEASWTGAAGEVRGYGSGSLTGRAVGAAKTAGLVSAIPVDSVGNGTCRYGQFAGGHVEVENDSSLAFTDALSASFWVRPNSSTGAATLLGKGSNYRIELLEDRRLALRVPIWGWDLLVRSKAPLAPNVWSHVGFTLDRRSLLGLLNWLLDGALYINGVKDNAGSGVSILWATNTNIDPLTIGGDEHSGFQGEMDEVRLERAVWSDSEFKRQAMATHWCGYPGGIDHFEFLTGYGAHTCSPQTVTVRACINTAPEVCEPYPGEVTVNLSSNGWIGGSTKTLTNGIGVFQLQGLQLSMPLGVASSSPGASNQTLCQIGTEPLSAGCLLQFTQSGFIFDVPDMIANQGAGGVSVSAVIDKGTEGSPRCEPAFINQSRAVQFWSEFVSPTGMDLSVSAERVWVNGSEVGQGFSNAVPVLLNFDGNGVSTLAVNYREAGKMQLNARYAGGATQDDSGVMAGSDDFVSRPAGFCIVPEQSCTAGDSSCPGFKKVGEPFAVKVRAVAWQADGDSDLCTGNATTFNYRQAGLSLAPVLVQPAGGQSGLVLTPASKVYDHVPLDTVDGWVPLDVAFSEVGVFRLGVTPPPFQYLGTTVPGSNSLPIGRFYPDHLKVDGVAALAPGCGVFSYQDQPITVLTSPTLAITGQGVLPTGETYPTLNYDFDGFWGFAERPQEEWFAQEREMSLSARLMFNADVKEVTDPALDQPGNGKRLYRWTGTPLTYRRSELPSLDDLPFSIRQRFSVGELTDRDGICFRQSGNGQCLAYDLDFAGSGIRLGRLRIGNAYGSELLPLELPWLVESWQAPGVFLAEAQDGCSAPTWDDPDLSDATGPLAAGPLPAVSTLKSGYSGILALAAPGKVGSVSSGFPNLPTWLWYDWRGNGFEAGRGLATFGIYKGPAPLIFRREVYRLP